MTEPLVSLVTTSYQGLDNLKRYLPQNAAVAAGTPLIGEIVVADDGSTDGSIEWLAREQPAVRVVALPANRGFGAAANAAVEAARFPYVLNISNDMVLGAGAAERLLDGFARSDVFSVSARLLSPDGVTEKGRTIPSFLTGDLKIWRSTADRLAASVPPGARMQHFSGAIGLFDRRLFLELGGYDDLYLPFFVEETDLFYRAWKRGYRVVYEPGACVTHHHRESSTILHRFGSGQRRVQFGKNRLLFIWKNIHDPALLGLHGVNLLLRVALSWAALDFDFYRALAGAFRRVGEIPAARARERALSVRGDREVFAEFRALLPPPA